MVLVDTSVWVSHLRSGEAHLKLLLDHGEVLCQPFVIGELACGNITNRREILTLMHVLPMTETASHQEVLEFIESRSLMGIGLGLIDVHLLASAFLSTVPLWTLDKRLKAASTTLGINYDYA